MVGGEGKIRWWRLGGLVALEGLGVLVRVGVCCGFGFDYSGGTDRTNGVRVATFPSYPPAPTLTPRHALPFLSFFFFN